MLLNKDNRWNLRSLLLIHSLIALLIASLFLEKTKFIWVPLDVGCFRFFNSWIKENSFFQVFWALANHRWADWVEDACFVALFTWIIMATPKGLRVRKAAECFFILLFSAAVILTSNELVFRGLLHVQRKSPTLVLDSYTFLPEKVTWLKVKAKSLKSYPGDHATTALLSIFGFSYLARGKRLIQILAVSYGIFLCLPRMIVGAHWITDVLIGSGSIVAVGLSLAFFTPLAFHCTNGLERLFLFLKSKKVLKDIS